MTNAALEVSMAGGLLTIDLDALGRNYVRLAALARPAECAAVVKADAYGLGASAVVPTLYGVGCRTFFVAHLAEGLDLRCHLPSDAAVIVLNGLQPGAEGRCAEAGIVPVLNGLEQVEAWAAACRTRGRCLPAVLQVDTGMSRLGLSLGEQERLLADRHLLDDIAVVLVMSHLACADEPAHPANAAQRERLRALLARAPGCRVSLANSAGILLEPSYGFDLVRPGIAVYGVDPVASAACGLRPVVRLDARVIQVRDVPTGTAVGYGAAFVTQCPSRIATVAVGYADGWPRHLSNRGAAFADGVRLPIAGRVSMDSITLDVTSLPPGRLKLGDLVELIGPHQTLDQVAAEAGTISYEILTSLGHRYARHYLGGAGVRHEPTRETMS